MASEPDDLIRRIEQLERRVADLEQAKAAAPAAKPVLTTLPPPGWIDPAPKPAIDQATSRLAPPSTISPQFVESRPPSSTPIAEASDGTSGTPPLIAAQGSPPFEIAQKPSFNLERFVGGRAYAAVGAVVVVIGVGMFLKLAVERGWFSFPPAARCASAAGFGLLLLVAGEWARRKIGAVASVGLSAAGIATTYAAVVAAYGWYKLVGAGPALFMLAAASALGVGGAVRAGQVLLAWIALVAAYFTPLVLWKAGMSVLVTPSYLLAVLGFALTLAARRPRPFDSVRGVAWWGTVLIGTLWSLGAARDHAPVVAGFVLLVWSAVHLEMVISAPAADQTGRGFWRRALISIGSTTWTAVIGAVAANWSRGGGGWTPSGWMVTGAMFVGACGLAHLLSGGLGWLMDRPRTERQRMGAVLWLESGALLIATVAMGIDGSAEVVCWLALGVAGVVAARWIGARPLAIYGLVLLSIAVGRILLWESWHGGVGRLALGIYMNRWTALAVAGAGALGVCATMLRVRAWAPAWRGVADACIIAACALAFFAAVHERSDPLPVAVWGAVVCAAAWGSAGWLRSAPIGVLAGLGTMSAMVLCAGRQLAGIERDRVEVVLGLAIGPWSVVIALVAAVWGLGAWICAMSRPRWLAGTVVASALGGAVALMLIPDLPMCRPGPLVVWWALIAVLLMAAHAIWMRTLPAGAGLAVLAAAAGSWIVLFPLDGWNASTAPVLLHPGLWVAALLAALAWGSAWWLRREGGDPEIIRVRSAVIAAGVGVLLFAATSLEVARAAKTIFASDRTSQNAAVSIWWGVFAAVLLVIGFASRISIVRHLGLALLGIATAKAVLIDLREVSPEWRVVSFIGLGLLMLGVAVGYAKLSRRLESGRMASEGTEGAA